MSFWTWFLLFSLLGVNLVARLLFVPDLCVDL